jgi:hypothetical protein
MLNTSDCAEYLATVRARADQIGLRESLEKNLTFLATYGCTVGDVDRTICDLYKDSAPLSFYFVMKLRQEDGSYRRWFNGGCIFHGPHDRGGDGGAPTFAVNLDPTHGWTIHT